MKCSFTSVVRRKLKGARPERVRDRVRTVAFQIRMARRLGNIEALEQHGTAEATKWKG